jgi:hypothetical protein
MGQALEPESWKEEKALTEKQRKKRYACKPESIIVCADLPTWDTVAEETLEEGLIFYFILFIYLFVCLF